MSTSSDALRVILYAQPGDEGYASAGAAVAYEIARSKMEPAQRACDLLSIALSVVTADFAGIRNHSPDGWTRQFELDIAVIDPEFWTSQASAIEQALEFLTTDIWKLRFQSGGWRPAAAKKPIHPEQDCVALVSGGLDSLVGAIDLASGGSRPYAVSQIVRGDSEKQIEFVNHIGGGLGHLQLNHNASAPGNEEASQRARSLIFITFGILAGTSLRRYHDGETIPLYVCENGFIAANPPLTGGRLGSLSTRTAHPEFLTRLQRVVDAAGLQVSIKNPYGLVTKGEMLSRCRDQKLLRTYAVKSTSCGRFQRFNYHHCGRCVPCQVRRAAFLAWGESDTTQYVYAALGKDDRDYAGFDDVRSVAMALAQSKSIGLNRWIGSALSYPNIGDRTAVAALVGRGLDELRALHHSLGVK